MRSQRAGPSGPRAGWINHLPECLFGSRQKSELLPDYLLPVSHKGIVPGHPTLNLFDSPGNDGHELSAISIDNDIILNPNSSCAPIGIYPLLNNEPAKLRICQCTINQEVDEVAPRFNCQNLALCQHSRSPK